MNGFFIPPVLQNLSNWEWSAFVHFDQNPFAGAFVQFFHRMIAYLLVVLIGWFGIKLIRQHIMPKIAYLLLGLLIVQVLLGIFTLIHSVSTIPVVLGVLHQAVAILLMTTLLYLVYRLRPK
jgi:cytochrome c oxidase assembly protein subunit 15